MSNLNGLVLRKGFGTLGIRITNLGVGVVKLANLATYPSGLREGSAKPRFTGSNPVVASTKEFW